ncbi:MAG: cytochrome P450 [Pseudomonadales bacterium]|nr:cytochrome P450 [Pseudomonadales bacterium]
MSVAEQEYNHMFGKDPYSVPLEDYDVSQPELFYSDTQFGFFERLRKEAPVHYCKDSENGPYWSVSSYEHILEVENNPKVFSSEPSITLVDPEENFDISMFIAMDEPKHGDQRRTVQGIVAPTSLATMEPIIRERIGEILDALPANETFDWVDKVSIELTGQMLATLFDFPFEERRKLTYWSDVATTIPGPDALIQSIEERQNILLTECLPAFTELWNQRVNEPPKGDLISMLAHGKETRDMGPMEFMGNLMLLIIGGNDTTRNSLSGGVYFLNQNPDQYEKLRNDHSLINTMVPEIIRYQTPLTHMRRTATEDYVLNGQNIKKGDKVAMWFISGNRDAKHIDQADDFIIDRPRPRQHLSFGLGIHRCMGNRLAEMQLRVAWEEILKRFDKVDVVGEPVRNFSPFVRGYAELPVQLRPLAK